MSNRTAKWLAWSIWVLVFLIGVAGRVLDVLNHHVASAPWSGDMGGLIGVTVGALIVSRRPSNRIGWLFLLVQVLLSFGGNGNLAYQYAIYAYLTRPGALPAGSWVLLIGIAAQILGYVSLIVFLLLLFPDGHLPSSRWRWIGWMFAVLIVFDILGTSISPAPLDAGAVQVPNPFVLPISANLLARLNDLSWLLGLVLLPFVLAAPFLRFRQASGEQREQLKWFAFGSLTIPLAWVMGLVANYFDLNLVNDLGLWQLAPIGIPIAVGVAILRYHLYDIDILIRRTLIYGILTILLAFLYFGSVTLLQELVRTMAGQTSDMAIILSTLAIAALFTPLRRRVQNAIDHRFYRRKYDAARVLAGFGATVRDEVDLNRLTDELLTVVEETMQPEQVSLWLKGSGADR